MLSDDEVTQLRRSAEDRLSILGSVLLAFDRRAEVLDVVSDSETDEVAQRAVMSLLDVDVVGAIAVLDLQTRRFTRRSVARIREEADDLRRRLQDDAWPRPRRI